MKKYMALYIGCALASKNTTLTKDNQQKGMQAWGNWMETIADRIVDTGGPLGRTLRMSANGLEEHSNLLTGYVIITADSHEEAASLFTNHPHFSIFPGDSVEIIECTEIPSI